MTLPDLGGKGRRPSLDLSEVLSPGRGEGCIVFHHLGIEFGVSGIDGGEGHALPPAKGLLSEEVGVRHAQITTRNQRLQGLGASQKVAAVGGIQPDAGESFSETPGLVATCVIQGDISVALQEALGIPGGLGVAYQEPSRHWLSPSHVLSPGQGLSLVHGPPLERPYGVPN